MENRLALRILIHEVAYKAYKTKILNFFVWNTCNNNDTSLFHPNLDYNLSTLNDRNQPNYYELK